MAITKHLVIHIDTAVTEQVVQVVPDRCAARGRQVDIGIHNGLLVRRGHFPDGPAIGACNQRTAQITRILLLTNAVGGGDKKRC